MNLYLWSFAYIIGAGSWPKNNGVYMDLITGFSIIVAATFITTWINDHVYKGEYIRDEI